MLEHFVAQSDMNAEWRFVEIVHDPRNPTKQSVRND